MVGSVRIRAIVVVGTIVGLQLAGITAAQSTATCRYRASDKSVRAGVSDFLSVVVIRSGDAVGLFTDNTIVSCGAATVTNTDTVVVSGTGGSADTYFANFIGIDESGGRLGPGATPEPSGHSEIEVRFNVTPGNSVFDPQGPLPLYLQYVGTPDRDRATVGENGMDVGSDGDVDVTSRDSFQGAWMFGTAGGDTFDLRAGSPGAAFAFPTLIDAGRGNDKVFGGTATDDVTAGPGKDAVDGGAGDDTLRTADGSADQVDGGEGEDTAEVDSLDTVSNVENVTKG
jgi:Ca2+-binding RTX toxin-like protein